jgi:hypothetical protein
VEGYWWFSPPSCCFNLIRWTPLTLGSSAFCCVRAGQAGDVPESRRHRLAVQAELGVFSEVCGHFYVAAGLWSAKRRLAESKDGVAVLKFCISCHIHQPSPVEATTSSQLGYILRLHSKAMPMALWHVSLLSCAHATKGTRTKGQWCLSDEVGHSRKVARTTCLPPQASSCPRACRSPPARIDPRSGLVAASTGLWWWM